MKVLVIQLAGVTSDLVFTRAALPTVGRVTEIGVCGSLEGPPSVDRFLTPPVTAVLAGHGIAARLLGGLPSGAASELDQPGQGDPPDLLTSQMEARCAFWFGQVTSALGAAEHVWVELLDLGLESLRNRSSALSGFEPAGASALDSPCSPTVQYCSFLDGQIAHLLDTLDETTIVTLLSAARLDEPGEGWFAIAGPSVPNLGALEGAGAADIVPTLLALAGIEEPPGLGGRPLVTPESDAFPDDDALLRERFMGLGYVA